MKLLKKPRYLKTKLEGRLKEKTEQAFALMEKCALCPRSCGAETGYCGANGSLQIASYSPHFGEEPPLSGTRGSGTIFFSHCSLRCIFCQNHDISIQGQGETAQTGQLASVMLHLQKAGCHNINLVTPTHFLPFILQELDIAAENGLELPIVYNTSGYESLEALKILDGVVDIYLPDFKFWNPEIAKKACNAPDYPERAAEAVMEMHRQTGDLQTDSEGVAVSGLLVRHLVLPDNLAGTEEIVDFLTKKVSENCRINIMAQYRPMYRAHEMSELSRSVSVEEYRSALKLADEAGLTIIR